MFSLTRIELKETPSSGVIYEGHFKHDLVMPQSPKILRNHRCLVFDIKGYKIRCNGLLCINPS
jgi:hypothetical protein